MDWEFAVGIGKNKKTTHNQMILHGKMQYREVRLKTTGIWVANMEKVL